MSPRQGSRGFDGDEGALSAFPVKPPTGGGDELTTSVLGAGAGVSLGGKTIGSGLTALQEILLARLLGSQAFGLYALGVVVLQLLIIPGSLGLNQGVVRFGSQSRRSDPGRFRDILAKSIGISALSASALGMLLFLLAPWLGEVVFRKPELVEVLRVVACALPLAAVLRVVAAATRVSLRMKYSVLSEDIAQPLAFIGIFIGLYAGGYRLAGALAALLVSFGFGLLLALTFLTRLYRKELRGAHGHTATRALLAFSLVTAVNSTITLAIGRMDRLMVGFYLPAAEVGIYQVASQVAVVFVMIVGAFNAVLAPMIPELFQRGQFDRIEELYRVGTRWALYVSLPAFLTIVVLRHELLGIVFGLDYLAASLPMVILCLGQMVNVATGGVAFVMIMTGRQHQLLLISTVVLLTSLGLYTVLTPRFGLVGTAVATALMTAALYVAAMLDVWRVYQIWPYDRRLVKGAFAALVTWIGLMLVTRWAAIDGVWGLILVGLLSVAVFGVVLVVQGLEQEDREFAGIVSARLKRLRVPGNGSR